MQQCTACKNLRCKLTNSMLAGLTSETDLRIGDTEIKGLHVRYYAKTGKKVFYLWYRTRVTKKQRNLKLGMYPEISASQAKTKAITYKGQVFEGFDPMINVRHGLVVQAEADSKKLLLKDVMEEYLETYSKVNKKPRTYQGDVYTAKREIYPNMGDITIYALNIRHVEKAVADCAARSKSQANRVIALMSHFLNWCETREYRPMNTNPCRHIKKFNLAPRDRVMSDAEYKKFFDALEAGKATKAYSPFVFDMIAFIALTGCRGGEAKALIWEEVDLDNNLLRLKKSKTGAKSVPVGKAAMDIVRSMLPYKRSPKSPVFPAGKNTDAPMVDIRKAWQFVMRTANITGLCTHDLRHSFATVASMTGENIAVVRTILGHSTISTTDRYTHINNTKGVEVADHIATNILQKAKK